MFLDKLDRLKGEVVAILISDIHLQSNPPVFRSAEGNWLEAQKRPLKELATLQKKLDCIVVCAGDVFDKWNPSPEIINFALTNLPEMYAVPGNHDLKYHNWEDLRKTAFWTLVKTKKITLIKPDEPIQINDVILHGFPYGFELKECPSPSKTFVTNIAVVHKYVWTKSTGHAKAQEQDRLKNIKKQLKGYDVLHFADNHTTFLVENENVAMFNPGSLMIRNADQKEHRPCVGLITRNHKVEIHYLNCSEDKYLEVSEQEEKSILDLSGVIEKLRTLNVKTYDFNERVRRQLQSIDVSEEVKQIVLKCCERK